MTSKDVLNQIIALDLEWPIWIEGVDPDLDAGLGLSWIWQLPSSHPLHWAGVIHDLEYQVRNEASSVNADKRFLRNCKKIAGKNLALLAQAHLFFVLASIVGYFRW